MGLLPAGTDLRNAGLMPATTVVLFGATGDLAKRKLLPGLLHLHESQLLAGLRVVATSLDELSRDEFLELVFASIRERSSHEVSDADLREFADRIHWVPGSAGRAGHPGRRRRVGSQVLGADAWRLHYLSVPPKAAVAVVHQLAEAGLVERSRIIMEKPFGTDLASAVALNAELHQVFEEEQISASTTSSARRPPQNILAFRFANGLFEPIWHRNHIDHIQIDVPETLGLSQRADFYEGTGAYRDMVVTHLFQVLAFTAMEPPTTLEPYAISEEKNKVFRSMRRSSRTTSCASQYVAPATSRASSPRARRRPSSRSKCSVDNWRWAGVPFYLHRQAARRRGARIISIALGPPRARCSRRGRASATTGLTT